MRGTGAVSWCSGTIGALVENSSNTQFVLGSNHVLARTSSATGSAVVTERIVQPGLEELGCWRDPNDTVAQLSAWAPNDFSGGENQLDAAIAKVVKAPLGPAGPMGPGHQHLGRDPQHRTDKHHAVSVRQSDRRPTGHEDGADELPDYGRGRSVGRIGLGSVSQRLQ